MKINNSANIQRMMSVYNKQNIKTKKTSSKTEVGKRDELKLSNAAQDFQTVLNAAKDVPEIRQEKVNEIKTQVESGEYKVDAKKIAAKMMAEARRR